MERTVIEQPIPLPHVPYLVVTFGGSQQRTLTLNMLHDPVTGKWAVTGTESFMASVPDARFKSGYAPHQLAKTRGINFPSRDASFARVASDALYAYVRDTYGDMPRPEED